MISHIVSHDSRLLPKLLCLKRRVLGYRYLHYDQRTRFTYNTLNFNTLETPSFHQFFDLINLLDYSTLNIIYSIILFQITIISKCP